MNKNKKGFTLIELLAVIVILAVIALIVTPIVTGIITSAKESANARSVEGHIKNVEYALTTKAFDNNGEISQYDGVNLEIDLNITYPSGDNIKCEQYSISSGTVLAASKCKISGKDYYYKQGSNASADATLISGIFPVIITEAKTNGTAIYFNPETGVKCTSAEAVSTTETKTGCMKWYVFNDVDGDSTVNLILDHNTKATLAWNTSGSNITGPSEITTQLWADTDSWTGVPTRTDSYSLSNGTATYTINYSGHKARLITAAEIAKISGNTTFIEATSIGTNYFYYDTNTTTASSTCTSGNITGCKYSWLYDRTNTDCKTTYGCSNNAESSYTSLQGYWVASAVSSSSTDAWTIYFHANMGPISVTTSSNYGLRPVITISKSLVY